MQLAQAQSKEMQQMQDSDHVAPQGETSHLNGNKDVFTSSQHDKGVSTSDKANQELNKAKKQLQLSTSDMR